MKKSQLKNIIKETLLEEKGYSKYIEGGVTDGLTPETLEQILLKIAQEGDDVIYEEEFDPEQVERGNKILDKADPENVARILRGEDPIYNKEVDRMQELAGLKQEIKISNPHPDAKYDHLLDKYGITKDWLLLHLGDIDELTPEEWDDLEFVEDRIEAHLDNQ